LRVSSTELASARKFALPADGGLYEQRSNGRKEAQDQCHGQ
jgi:hypothetical protein